MKAKGKRDVVRAWRVVAVDADASGIERRLDSPLVDRVEELERLRRVVGLATAERRAVVATVVGPAGVGKSRLVHELVARLAGNAIVLTGKCVAYGGTTYRPLVEILRNAGGPEAVTRALAGEENEQLLAERLEAAEVFRRRRTHGRDLLGRAPVRRSQRTAATGRPRRRRRALGRADVP